MYNFLIMIQVSYIPHIYHIIFNLNKFIYNAYAYIYTFLSAQFYGLGYKSQVKAYSLTCETCIRSLHTHQSGLSS